MNKTEFFEMIKDGVLANLRDTDPTLDGAIQQVTKINNIIYHGLSLRSDNNRVAPMIYLDDFFSRYSDNDISIDDIVNRVTEVYKKNIAGAQDIDVSNITDYDIVKTQIIPAVCNFERSSEYLKSAPFERICDLAVYYRILIDMADGEGSILVSSQLMETWGISFEDLKDQAWKNLHEINPPFFATMFDVLKEIMPAFDASGLETDTDNDMYILSNKSRINGAVYIADTKVLGDIANKLGTDIILLSSSRHELVILPYTMAADPERWSEMAAMVSEINQSTVSDEDFLADSVYYFTRESGTVKKVA